MSTQEVSVTLATNVVSVTGTVNGTVYEWVRNGDTWTAIVTAEDDGRYVVELTIVDTFGITTTASIILYYGLNLVMDRTSADVQRVEYLLKRARAGTATVSEMQELLDPSLKGAYNHTDMNRVGAAVYYLRDRLNTLCGIYPSVTAKRDWTQADIPRLNTMSVYLGDVATLRESLSGAMPSETPDLPSDMTYLTYAEANDIERNLWYINFVIIEIIHSWRYAGEYYSGEA